MKNEKQTKKGKKREEMGGNKQEILFFLKWETLISCENHKTAERKDSGKRETQHKEE